MRIAFAWIAFATLIAFTTAPVAAAEIKILTNHLGYEPQAPKRAVIRGDADSRLTQFEVVDANSGKAVVAGTLEALGPVRKWRDWVFWRADFSNLRREGTYYLRVGNGGDPVQSSPFLVQEHLLERNTLSDVIYYFKGQRSSGPLDAADRKLKLPPPQAGELDAHGGWYDATGDYGKHLSHQNPASYFNPQQTPLTVWSLLQTHAELERRGDVDYSQYKRRLLDEALYGADFLVRLKRSDGSFYETINAPGPGKLPQDRAVGDPNWKTQIKRKPGDETVSVVERKEAAPSEHAFEASLRAGAGMSIAALARASTMGAGGEFTSADYLRAAQSAFEFLERHNRELLNDGVENITDDYCGVLAATELFRATKNDIYLKAADRRADQLMSRLVSHGQHRDYWRADDRTRPFFHPSDAGLPVVSLLEYHSIANAQRRSRVLDVVRRSLAFELGVTDEVNNPFGYARQLVRRGDGRVETAFFFPHDTEAAPWWQGENARLASLATAARLAARVFDGDPKFRDRLRAYAWNQLNWILGLNPFDASMLEGTGRNNVQYLFFNTYQYTNAPGGIVNGITAGLEDESDIDLNRGYRETGADDDWRWAEQWLPHASWYMLAVASGG